MSDKPLFLRIYKGEELVGIKQFKANQIVIGSGDDTDAKLDGDSVSAIHAMIDKRDDGYYLSDLGSESGVMKSGEKVLDGRIDSGEQFEIGPFTIEFYEGIPKPKAKPDDKTVYQAPPAAPKVPEKKPEPKPQPKPEPKPKAEAKPQQQHIPQAPPTPAPTQPSSAATTAAPVAATAGGLAINTYRKKSTFAPPNPYGDVQERLKPEKGTTVEVVVAWNDTIIETRHYNEPTTITVGSHPKNDIILPVFGSSAASHPLIEIHSGASVFFTSDMTGAVTTGNKRAQFDELIAHKKVRSAGVGYILDLEQGSMVRVDFGSGVSIFVRYVSQPAKPLIGPFFDLTSRELTNIVLTIGLTMVMALLFLVLEPKVIEEEIEEEEEIKRVAVFQYVPPPRPIEPVPIKEPVKVKVEKKQPKARPQKQRTSTEGKASDAPRNDSKSTKKIPTTAVRGKDKGIKTGGRTKRGKGQARGGQPRRDVKKSGLLGVFGSGGQQDSLRSSLDGAGDLSGAAETATGSGSQVAMGSGTEPGGGLNELGAGGQGESTYGISGVNTKGRGGGTTGYGTGALGRKAGTTIVPGGEEEAFEGGIDREAVRRVVLRNLNELKACYERVTRVDPTVGGKVVLNWTIVARGRVGEARVASSDIKNRAMLNCMISRLRTWRFPEPPEGLVGDVTYPFVFAATSN